MGETQGQTLDEFGKSVPIAVGSRSLVLSIQSWSDKPGVEKAGLISYAFYDKNEAEIKPSGRYSNSAQLGPYFYLTTSGADGTAITRAELLVPNGAVRCELKGHIWKTGVHTHLQTPPRVSQPGSNQDSVFDQDGGQFIPMDAADFVGTYDVDKLSDTVVVSSSFRAVNSAKSSKALILVELLDANGEVLLPAGDLPVNPTEGPFIYLESPEGEETASSKTASIRIPVDCAQLRLRGRHWSGDSIELLEPPAISYGSGVSDVQGAMSDFLESVPLEASLIVIYTTARAIGSGSLLLRSNRLALEYADAGNWVLFFPFGSLAEDEPVRPHERILQAERQHFRTFMDLAMRRQGKNNKFICSSFSDLNVAASMDRMRDNSWTVVYEVRDDMEEFHRVGYSKWFNPLLEARVAKRADKIVAVSPRLKEKVETISGRSDVHLIPNAAPDELVFQTSYLRHPKSIEARMKSRTVGYIGHLTPSWFDWDLLIQAARALPSIDFEIIGHGFPKGLQLPINVTYLGAMPHRECIQYAERWRAGLIPFKISPLTYGVDPNKIYEYVAMGLRTVSAPMGSVQDIPGTWVYENVQGAVAGIEDAVTREITDEELSEYDEYIRDTKWSDRARQMLELLEGES
ncbi:hypothetical protein AAE021_03535 [Arthrobacter citreus]|uniref:Glycosyltransferase n=1 Tax=Arthrobacter citreus TaxID=1670 RepID=A0ABZ2ZZS3_9MICC